MVGEITPGVYNSKTPGLKMEQPQLKNKIKLFLKGELSPTEELELLQWIKQSAENKNYFYKLQQKIEKEIKFGVNETVRPNWERLLNRIERAQNPKRKEFTFRRYYHYAASVAAAFIIGFFIATLVIRKTNTRAVATITEQKISTPYGARTQFVLPDSSVVWLNAGSELLFPSQFKDKRPVKLVGEAFFDVKKSDIPFIVSTEYGEVEVKGTSFDVKAYPEDPFETTLVTGEVHVLTEDRGEAILRPGSQAILSEKGLQVKPVETELFTSWKEGKLIFRNEYLPELIKRLERWYNVKIEMKNDPRLKNINYTGTIEMESFSEVLNLLSVTAPVSYTWNEKTRVIKLFYKEKSILKEKHMN